MLGARHVHRVPVAERVVANDARDGNDPMGGWRDFRRMQYGDAHSHSHERAHALGIRHHHGLGDPSVINDDASDFAGAASSDTAQASASFIFIAVNSAFDLPPSSEAFGLAWHAVGSVVPDSADPRRIERPPQRPEA